SPNVAELPGPSIAWRLAPLSRRRRSNRLTVPLPRPIPTAIISRVGTPRVITLPRAPTIPPAAIPRQATAIIHRPQRLIRRQAWLRPRQAQALPLETPAELTSPLLILAAGLLLRPPMPAIPRPPLPQPSLPVRLWLL